MNEKQYIQTELDRLPDDPPDRFNSQEAFSINRTEEETISWLLLVRELVQVVVPAIVLAFLVQFFLAQPTVVYGQSMEPSLYPHQRLIIDKLSYRLALPQRHDIVVIDMPTIEQLLVKRIIGLPGDTIEFSGGTIYVNGTPDNNFIHVTMVSSGEPLLQLADHQYFVLGDNLDNSNDSRSFGPVSDEYLVGRVWLRYWPLNQLKYF